MYDERLLESTAVLISSINPVNPHLHACVDTKKKEEASQPQQVSLCTEDFPHLFLLVKGLLLLSIPNILPQISVYTKNDYRKLTRDAIFISKQPELIKDIEHLNDITGEEWELL